MLSYTEAYILQPSIPATTKEKLYDNLNMVKNKPIGVTITSQEFNYTSVC